MKFDSEAVILSFQTLIRNALQMVPYILIATVVFLVFLFAARGTRRVIMRLTDQRRKHRNVGIVLGRLAEGGLMLVGLLVGLVIAVPSFNPGQLVQLLGISSVAIGFAFRDILQNFLAGILILLTEPFHIDDQIIVGDFEGTVENIEARATVIKTYDGRRVVIPNATIFNKEVTVNTAYPQRRLQYDIGIGYGDDVEAARRLILNALSTMETVSREPAPEALVVDLAGSSVNIRVRWWIEPPRRLEAVNSISIVLTRLKEALVEAGFDLPFPTQQILFHDQTEETDGDRLQQREGWPSRNGKSPGSRSVAGAIRSHSPNGTTAPSQTNQE